MILLLRTSVVACGILATSAVLAQGGDGEGSDEPDIYTKMKAVQVYMEDGSATMMARACAETDPVFMSKFIPKFTSWRAENAKQIALGSKLSVQFSDPKGEPMDPAVLGRAAAEKVRSAAPDERSRECDGLLRDVSGGG